MTVAIERITSIAAVSKVQSSKCLPLLPARYRIIGYHVKGVDKGCVCGGGGGIVGRLYLQDSPHLMSSLFLLDPHTLVLCLSPPDTGVVPHRRICEALVSWQCMFLNHTGLPVGLHVYMSVWDQGRHLHLWSVYTCIWDIYLFRYQAVLVKHASINHFYHWYLQQFNF